MKFRFCLILFLICAAVSSANAAAPVGVKEYLAMRRHVATKVPLQELRAHAGQYIGKVFEIRGRLAGTLKTDDNGCCLIISSENPETHENTSYSVSTDVSPTDTGVTLACLVKIGENSACSLTDLKLVACTFLIELERTENAAVKAAEAAAAAAAKRSAAAKSAQAGKTKYTISSEELVRIYARAIRGFNCKLSSTQADTIARSILGFSLRYKLDPRLVCAVILAESHFKIGATSRCGAQGLGQLMPSTAAGMGVNDAYDPVQNIYGSVRYVKGMLDRMSGNKEWNELTWYDLALALAAYNAGPGAVKKHGGVPPYKETQNYVRRVTSIYKKLCGVK